MANNKKGNPWILTDAENITSNPQKINYMEWIPNAAADDLTILDCAGNTIWDVDAIAPGTAGKEKFDPGEIYIANGFNLSVIDGGTLYVYRR